MSYENCGVIHRLHTCLLAMYCVHTVNTMYLNVLKDTNYYAI